MMRRRENDPAGHSSPRATSARVEKPESAAALNAVQSSRSDVAGPAGVLALQRAVGNAGVAALIGQHPAPVRDVDSSGGTPSPSDPARSVDAQASIGESTGAP